MAAYRLYKNGIYGRRYKKLYIVKRDTPGTKIYDVIDEDRRIVKANFTSAKECEWYIDKFTASPETLSLIQALYSEELYKLSEYYGQLQEKQEEEGLRPDETMLLDYVIKVRKRKAEGKSY